MAHFREVLTGWFARLQSEMRPSRRFASQQTAAVSGAKNLTAVRMA